MKEKSLLIQNGTVITFSEPPLIEKGGVGIVDGKIRGVYKEENIQSGDFGEVWDVGGRVVMPSFVNCHTHLYGAMARGAPLGSEGDGFIGILKGVWWKLDRALTEEDVFYSTIVSGLEAISSGVTTLFDHHSSPSFVRGSLKTIARGLRELGLRACLSYEVSDRDGKEKDSIEENISFLDEAKKEPGFLSGLFGLHSSFTLSDKTLEAARKEAGETGFHIHVLEDRSDESESKKRWGRGVIERLSSFDILGPKTLAAHGVWLTQDDMKRFSETGTTLVHNPRSNSNNAVGRADIPSMVRNGVKICLGTDGYTQDLIGELGYAALIHKEPGSEKNLNDVIFHEIAFLRNSEVAEKVFDRRMGKIEKGYEADIVVIDYVPTTPITPSNLSSHLTFGVTKAPVISTVCAGKVLMKERKLTYGDLERALWVFRKLSKKLWERL